MAELLAEQRSGNSREVSPAARSMAPAAAGATAIAAAGAAAVLSDEQAAEEDLEEVCVYSIRAQSAAAAGCKGQTSICRWVQGVTAQHADGAPVVIVVGMLPL